MAKKFFLACLGTLMLALALHMLAPVARTQGTGAMTPVSMNDREEIVMANGDVWAGTDYVVVGCCSRPARWQKIGNVFSSNSVSCQPPWDKFKA